MRRKKLDLDLEIRKLSRAIIKGSTVGSDRCYRGGNSPCVDCSSNHDYDNYQYYTTCSQTGRRKGNKKYNYPYVLPY